MEVLEAEQRVDVQAGDRVRVVVGDLLDVHPALRREHHERLLGRAVEDDRRVVLGGDVRGRLDPDLVHGEAADVHAEDRAGVLLGLAAVLRDLDAAGLAAAADQHLRLDHARVADLVGGGDRLLDGRRPARRTGTGTPWRANSCLPWYSRRSMRGADSRRKACHNARPHAAPQGSHLRHVRRLRNPHRLRHRDLRGVLQGGRERRLHDLPRRARRRSSRRPRRRSRAGPTSSTPRSCAAPPCRSPSSSAGRSSPRAPASCPTRSSAGRRSRRPTRSSSASRRSSRSG